MSGCGKVTESNCEHLKKMWHWFEHSQIYHPSRELECTAAEAGCPCEDVWFNAADGTRLNAWFAE